MTDTIAPATGGQGAPATPSAEPTPISSAPAAGTVPQNTPVPQTWLDGLSPETTGYVQNKGWKNPADMLNSYQQLEKHMGTSADRLLRLPDFDKADKSELDLFFSKLGRPADPGQYELPVPQGMPTDFADAAKAKFHELGITGKQAKALAEWNNEYIAQAQSKMTSEFEQNVAQQQMALKKEWGAAYDQNDLIAGKVMEQTGLNDQQLQAITRAIGFDAAMKAFANLGQKLGEHGYVDGGNSESGGMMTPAGAKARISQLQHDKDWTSKYLAGNVQARAEMDRLMKFAYPA